MYTDMRRTCATARLESSHRRRFWHISHYNILADILADVTYIGRYRAGHVIGDGRYRAGYVIGDGRYRAGHVIGDGRYRADFDAQVPLSSCGQDRANTTFFQVR